MLELEPPTYNKPTISRPSRRFSDPLNSDAAQRDAGEGVQALYSTFALSFETLTTRWLVGDLSPENMKGNMGAMLYAYVFLVIVVIIMFNLLIAIMGDSYDKIREHQVSGRGNDIFTV